MKKRFNRKTKGFNAQVFVAKAMNFTTDGTLDLFLQNAPLGEIGVYDGSNALHNNAITSGEEFYFVMKTTEGLKTSPRYKLSEVTVRKVVYKAPVKQATAIGWNGTGGATNHETIAQKQNFGLKIMETTQGYDPFPTWNFEYTTKASDEIIDVMLALAKKINDDRSPENQKMDRLVVATVKADATYSNYAASGTTPTLTVTNGSTVVQIGSGDSDGEIDFTLGDLISFSAGSTPSDSVGDIYRIVAVEGGADSTITLDRPYQGPTQTFSEAEAEGTRVKKVATVVAAGLLLTSLEDDATFQVAVNENLINADLTLVTKPVFGSGTSDKVIEMEKEGRIFAGETTNMVPQPEKWGQQDTFAVDGETYDLYHVDFLKSTPGIAPDAQYHHKGNIVIAAAKSTGNVGSTLNTLFGV